MHENLIITYKNNKFYLSGEVNFNNVMPVYKNGILQFNHQEKIDLDFSELKNSDSSAIALIVEWMKWARANNKSIKFHHLSSELLAIVKAAGMDHLILQ